MESNDETKKNIIIAIPSPVFADGLSKHFENEGLNVIETFVVIDHLVERLHEIKSDNLIKLDAIILSSAITTKLSDKRLELLADILENIRNEFSETSIIFLSDETEGHPLLAELISMGIYNIFVKSDHKSATLDIKQLVRCIDTPLLYSEIKKYKNYDTSIPWRRTFLTGGQTLTINIEGKNKEKNKNNTSNVTSESGKESETNITKEDIPLEASKEIKREEFPPPYDDFEDEEILTWQIQTSKQKVLVRDRIVGKSVIAVTGVDQGVGTTHTALLIGNYLSRCGYKVKIIECGLKNEFVYIEKAYEGKNANTSLTKEFEIQGITFVKSTDEIDMAYHLTSEHTHFILDLGSYSESDYSDEFHRASQQFIVAAGGEWKQYTINQFIHSNKNLDITRSTFLVPMVNKQTINDIKSSLDEISAFELPYHPDPFLDQSNTDNQLNHIFETGLTKRIKPMNKLTISIGCVLILFVLLVFIKFI